MFISICIYFVNQNIKKKISIDIIYYFANCYLNDILAGIVFIAYVNTVHILLKKNIISKLLYIELLLLFCGFYWEIITPMFLKYSTKDIVDIFAYCFGGFLYWLSIRKNE